MGLIVDPKDYDDILDRLENARQIIVRVKEVGLYPWPAELNPKTHRIKELTEAAIDDWLKTC